MKFIRKKNVVRVFCLLCTITMLNSIVAPTVSYALTSGQFQPEYTSYEDGASTDMVNLLTGDFSFTMPILNVPVRDGSSFSVPLSYHAGIGLEQEASWTGLGWNLNVGSITRTISGFPDDAVGESQTINVKDLTGRRGWYAQALAGAMGWDSQVGKYGALKFSIMNASWNDSETTVGIAGIYVGDQARVDGGELAVSVVKIVSAIISYGGSSLYTSLVLDVASDIMDQYNFSSNFEAPRGPSLDGHWQYSERKDTRFLGLYTNYWYWLDQSRVEEMYGVLNLDKSPSEALGTEDQFHLKIRKNVLGNSDQSIQRFSATAGTMNKGAASDISIDLSSGTSYRDLVAPSTLAYDNFNVNGPGISGPIKPYRLEVGSVSVPREMSQSHVRYNPIPYMDYGTEKVPFVYDGGHANRYFNHVGHASATVTSPTFHYGISSTVATNAAPGYSNPDALRYDMTDFVLHNQKLSVDVIARKKLPQDRFVEWMKNSEIRNTTGRFNNTAYLDYFSGPERITFRDFYTFGASNTYYGSSSATSASNSVIQLTPGVVVPELLTNSIVDVSVMQAQEDPEGGMYYVTLASYSDVQLIDVNTTSVTVNVPGIDVPANGTTYIEIYSGSEPKTPSAIGGFVITGIDGMNYHYALPSYDYNMKSYNERKTDASKNSTMTRSGQFANTWLLTGITGPDFIDRGGTNNIGNGVIDESDWGYWIKFNYGRHTSDYKWRTPYGNTGNETISSSDDLYKSYSEGYKEKFYLNAIETPSHVALFVKDPRKDAKAAGTAPATSLRLGEMLLITREVYNKVTDPADIYKLAKSSGTTDVMYRHTGGALNNNITGAIETYLKANCLRNVALNYDETYPLCMGAPNSDAGFGKLTLKSVSVMGRNSTKILPDYKFDYANNPVYNKDKWDGWGMYNSAGTSVGTTHKASNIDADGAAWSMTSITSPLGHVIDIQYERDRYGSISGNPATTSTQIPPSYEEGERVTITQREDAVCTEIQTCEDTPGMPYQCVVDVPVVVYDFWTQGTVQNGVVVPDTPVPTPMNVYTCTQSGAQVSTILTGPNTFKYSNEKRGGNIRVKSLTLRDHFTNVSYKTNYLYTLDSYPASNSSGVVSMEPDYIRNSDNDWSFYNLLGYPMTPVMYSKVTVLQGPLSNNADFTSKQVFSFETPNTMMYLVNSNKLVKDKIGMDNYNNGGTWHDDLSTLTRHEIQKRFAKIGKIKSIKLFDKTQDPNIGAPVSSVVYEYTETLPNNQGVFTEATLRMEMLAESDPHHHRYHKLDKTTVIEYPWVLSKVTKSKDGRTEETKFVNWDLITGMTTERHNKSMSGMRTKSVIEPLYLTNGVGYGSFGSKAYNASNKNMLSQIGATYTYLADDQGKEMGLIGASANVWNRDWSNYRKFSAGAYSNSYDADDTNGNASMDQAEIDAQKVWRKSTVYTWIGNYGAMTSSGAHRFTVTDKFNFSAPASNLKWLNTGSFERFGHGTQILESKDMNGLYSSTKYGYNEFLAIASATNAKFEEIAFSSAEDLLANNYFSGEVFKGTSATVVTTPVHTGTKALSLSTGYGFVFKSAAVAASKKYRASVWSNNQNGRIYYKIKSNGTWGAEVIPATHKISQAVTILNGTTWYRLDAVIDIGAAVNPEIEVGVKSTSGTVVFDDFRFQPFDAVMKCFVYSPATLDIQYVLGDDNTFTRFEYNDRGMVIKEYGESLTFGEKLMKESISDYKRFHVGN
jgi:hypothetical protein